MCYNTFRRWCSTGVVQLIRNQQVVSSNLTTSSTSGQGLLVLLLRFSSKGARLCGLPLLCPKNLCGANLFRDGEVSEVRRVAGWEMSKAFWPRPFVFANKRARLCGLPLLCPKKLFCENLFRDGAVSEVRRVAGWEMSKAFWSCSFAFQAKELDFATCPSFARKIFAGQIFFGRGKGCQVCG